MDVAALAQGQKQIERQAYDGWGSGIAQQKQTAFFQNPAHFLKDPLRLGIVMEGVVAEHDVKGCRVKGQPLGVAQENVGPAAQGCPGGFRHFRRKIQARIMGLGPARCDLG